MTAVLGLSGAFAWATADLVAVRSTRAYGPLATTFWLFLVGGLVLVPVKLIADRGEPFLADWSSVGYAAGAGLLDVIGFLALTRGLRTGNLSVVAPVSGLSGAFAACIAIGLGERPGALTAAGLGIAVLGGALTSSDGRLGSAAGAGWAVLAALSFGGLFVLLGEAGGITPYETALVARVVGVAAMVPFVLLARSPIPFGRNPLGLTMGLADATGFVLFAVATQRGPLSVASVTGAQVATFGAILGILLLRERLRPWQLLGIAVTAGGVSLLALD